MNTKHEQKDVNKATTDDGSTALIIASQNGHADVVSLLLGKEGVDVNQATNDGRTPLYIASWKGHSEVVSMLLAKQGVDVNQATYNGCTPLYIASHKGHSEVVSMLLAKEGIDVNQATNNGATPESPSRDPGPLSPPVCSACASFRPPRRLPRLLAPRPVLPRCSMLPGAPSSTSY